MLHHKKFILTSLFSIFISFMLFSCSPANNGSGNNPVIQPKLDGVNFGGVFILEDWLFTKENIGHSVSTSCQYKDTGIASSNIFTNSPQTASFTWTSETNLIDQLLRHGYSEEQVADLFQQHRDTYLFRQPNGPKNYDETFALLHRLGINIVRLPLPWALTYPDHSYTINPGNNISPVIIPAANKIMLVSDPFFVGAKWASLPITQVESILKTANAHHVKILLDIHTFPGGASDGPFTGIWPKAPRFWTTGMDSNNIPIYQQNFQTIFNGLINWASMLKSSDPEAFEALAGLTPMNEPAHLLGIPAARCDGSSAWGVTDNDVLATLALAIQDFKNSSLPDSGVKLYMNVIESIFPSTEPNVYSAIGNWWKTHTTSDERSKWAVLDLHHYIAWDTNCNACLQNDVDANNNITQSGFAKVKQCSRWFLNIRDELGLLGSDLLATSEFSASTNSDTWGSCASGVVNQDGYKTPNNYQEYRNAFLEEQLKNGNSANVSLMFWQWMIPDNTNYQNEWDLFNICSGNNPPTFCKLNAY